jgi:hypothetical protein
VQRAPALARKGAVFITHCPDGTLAVPATARSRFDRTIRFTISVVENHRSLGREMVYSVPRNTRMARLIESFQGTACGFGL